MSGEVGALATTDLVKYLKMAVTAVVTAGRNGGEMGEAVLGDCWMDEGL